VVSFLKERDTSLEEVHLTNIDRETSELFLRHLEEVEP